jgi:transposase
MGGVSEAVLLAHCLDDDYYGVKRAYTFEHQGETVTDVALVTLSLVLRRKQRRHRADQIGRRLATLCLIAKERLNVRKYKRRTYAEEQIQKQVLGQPGGEFIQVDLSGEDGRLTLHWHLDRTALKQAMRLDGKFLLVTNDRTLSGAQMVARYGEKDKVEKGYRTLKGPIRIRPVYLHKDERIEALMFVNMLALLVYSILEMKCRRQGLVVTGEAVLKGFAYLSAVYTTFTDGSVQLRVEERNPFQRQVVKALGQSWWPTLLGCSPPVLPEPQVYLRPRWDKIPVPLSS